MRKSMKVQGLSSIPAVPGGLRRELAEGPTLPEAAELHAAKRMTKEHWARDRLLFAAVVVIGVLQYLTPPTTLHWLYVLQRLYYVAIVLAGLDMGWRGA